LGGILRYYFFFLVSICLNDFIRFKEKKTNKKPKKK